MRVIFTVGNIVNTRSEGLVSSGNVQLNMSGGVNGEVLKQGGSHLQKQLHDYLQTANIKYVEPGFVMRIGPEPLPFKTIVYAVAINAFYKSNQETVEKTLVNALKVLAEDNCRTIAVPALATGYGNLKLSTFGEILKKVVIERPWLFEELNVVLRNERNKQEVEEGYLREVTI
jgi:O-acetyl-ADP-ribose deacetylase (regulator of RNase III)